MSIEKGPRESESEKDPVLSALDEKLKELGEFSGKTSEAAMSRYKGLVGRIIKGDQDAYMEVAREFGLEETKAGKQRLSSEGMKLKEISPERKKEIDEALDRHK